MQGMPRRTMSRSVPTRRLFLRGDKGVFKGTDHDRRTGYLVKY